jgi:hypothetical protein
MHETTTAPSDVPEASAGACVVLDTNVWRAQPLLRTSHGAALIFALQQRGTLLGLPEIVERELPEVLVRAARKVLDKTSLLAQIIGQRVDLPDETKIREAVKTRLGELEPLLIRVPLTFHQTQSALTRVIEGTPPNREGKEEFKDSLILEAVFELAADRVTDFITGDSGFYESRDRLHRELNAEIESRSLQVGLHGSLESYLSSLGGATLPEFDREALISSLAKSVHASTQDAMTPYGLTVEELINGEVRVFATEVPGRTAVSYTLNYAARGQAPAEAIKTVVRSSGEATANFASRRLSDIRPEEVKFATSEGGERGTVYGSTLDTAAALVRHPIPLAPSEGE